MKALKIIALICLVAQAFGATVVAPNGMDAIEGDSGVIPLFGGEANRTQMIYAAPHFSLFPPEGAYITELRFRMDGQFSTPFSGTADVEIHLSTRGSNPDQLRTSLFANIGPDETIVLPRRVITLGTTEVNPGGPNSFSVVIPLPTQFYYNPAAGNLLVDASVFGIAGLRNLDWSSSINDGASSAEGSLTGDVAGTTSTAPIVQFVYTSVPEPAVFPLIVLALLIFILKRQYVAS